MSYEYVHSNGIELKVIKTSPNNIELLHFNESLHNTDKVGINGGFFYGSAQLSIAVNNDIPIKGKKGDWGSGWFNEKYARGTLVWDKSIRKYSVQVVSSADELIVSDRSNYWAQGGVSMGLQDEAHWKSQAVLENLPDIDVRRPRTGLVYSRGMNIWLIASVTPCTAHEFRHAIKGQIGSETIVDGIFLDSGGSTQLQSKEGSVRSTRKVLQIVSLINK